ncbi:hypothetical protein ACU42Y_11745 [Proteus mirabilis]
MAHGALLDALGMDSLESGLVFTCTIGGLPDDTFQLPNLISPEGLSSLFSLSISAVSLPFTLHPFPAPSWLSLIINGQTRWCLFAKSTVS